MTDPEDCSRSGGRRSTAYCAMVTLNDLLVGVYEQLLEGRELEHLPSDFCSVVNHLTEEVARLQEVTEWVTEDLVRLMEEDESGE